MTDAGSLHVARSERGAIVLCGGQSRRMGLAKATLPFGNETLLERIVRRVGEAVAQVIVVSAPGQEIAEIPAGTTIAHDRRAGRGPLEGLAAGLAAAEPHIKAVFLAGCDVPFVAPALIERMFAELEGHEIVVPRDDRFHHPLAAVYRVGIRSHVDALLGANRLRTADLFERCDTREIPLEQLRDVDPELLSFQNLNHPRDYLDAMRRAGFPVRDDVLRRFG